MEATIEINKQQLSIVDHLLQQLQDQYNSVHSQNIIMPKQNILPEQDLQNPYQSLDFEDQDQKSDTQYDYNQNHEELHSKQQYSNSQQLKQTQEQNFHSDIQTQIQNMKISQSESNPQIKQQLVQILPTSQQIFTNIPHKQFEIDQDKIKSFALEMQINQPQWLKDQSLCNKRIQELFNKPKNVKCFTKI